MTRILFLDTATTEQGAIVSGADEAAPPERWRSLPRGQAGDAVRRLLGSGSPEAVAVGRGPGGFTSLRSGMALAMGVAWAGRLPLLTFSSLRLLALRMAEDPEDRAAAIDAGGEQAYLGIYRGAGAEIVEFEGLVPWAEVTARIGVRPLAVAVSGPRPSAATLPGAALVDIATGLERLSQFGESLEIVGYDGLRPAYFQEPAAVRRRSETMGGDGTGATEDRPGEKA